MKRLSRIAVLCCILPCSGCAVGSFLLESLLDSDSDTDSIDNETLDRMGYKRDSKEARALEQETDNVRRVSEY